MSRAIDEGAEACILGCADMAELALDLQDQLDVPVIDGVDATIRLAEALGGSGLAPSKVGGWAYPSRA